MSLTQRRTHANGIPVTINEFSNTGRRRESAARRLAASLPRGASYVRRVENAPSGVDLWIETPQDADTSMVRYPTPDGYSVKHISHFSDGTLCVTYEVDA